MAQKEKSPSGKKGTCSNCGREKFIADKKGHCGTCHTAVEGMDPESAAYAAALATVKDRINKPGFKTRKAKPFRPIRISKAKFKSNALPKLKEIKSTLDMTIKEVANTGIPGIIQRARNEQAAYLQEADKLGKAIKILESL